MEARTGRNLASLVLGTLLILVGALLFAGQVVDVDLFSVMWPIFVIIPGAMFFVVMATGGKKTSGFAFPATIITTTGLLLLYQSLTNHWESWAYAWTLIMPTAIGVAMMIHGAIQGDERAVRTGGTMAIVGTTLFLLGIVFFEFVLDISGRAGSTALGVVGGVLLIAAGAAFIVLGGWRSRRGSSGA